MLWELELVDGQITVQAVIDAIVDLLKKIFAFIIDEEGWVAEDETTTA